MPIELPSFFAATVCLIFIDIANNVVFNLIIMKMKKIFLVLFTCTLFNVFAQKQYQCYHLQEFLWNTETQLHDSPVEKNDGSVFYFNDEKKTIQQVYEDGATNVLIVKSIIKDDQNKTTTYYVKSAVNGYNYLYQINSKASVIEISLNENNQQTILKKYLYKN